MLDGYAMQHGHRLNINVFNRETLIDAMEHRRVSTINDSCIWIRCKLH